MKRILLTISIVLAALALKAQDIHFSQFFATPLFTNPAFTGQFEGTYRFHGIVRNQWASVSSQPFQTFGGSVDFNNPFGLSRSGFGLQVSHDFAGLSDYTNTHAYASFAKGFGLFGVNGLSLRIGAMAGAFQSSYSTARLNYGSQFNGIRFDPNMPSLETVTQPTVMKFNFNAGAYLRHEIGRRAFWGIGFSSFNLTEPDRAFFKSYEIALDRRYDAHAFTSIPIGALLDLQPAARYMMQGTHSELMIGTALRYHLSTGPMNPRSIQIGGWYRTADAAILSGGMQLNDLYLGGSYDFNVSRLLPATHYRGGWEFTVIYIIPTIREKIKRIRQCPDYL